ncbi:MAG: hypothetical protein F9K29_10595 [Hyphomicrobiaceae bacterium]|nr:MAG: hypothetical protein F9K29_10595 [Hyphomicrobiaceae bacterium]
MQMHDTLRQAQGASVADVLAASFGVTAAQAAAVIRAANAEITRSLTRLALSRGGLADLVDLLGRSDWEKHVGSESIFKSDRIREDGNLALQSIMGGGDRAGMLAARAARASGLRPDVVEAMLPGLAVAVMGMLAVRAKKSLGEILGRMPSLGRWSKGNPHADLADVLRRRCGSGPYARRKLRKTVHRALAHAGSFESRSALGWYGRFMLIRPAMMVAGPVASILLPRR